MQIPERITIRLGNLRGPLEKRLNRKRCTPSEYVRRLLASDLGVHAPVMRPGPISVTVSTKTIALGGSNRGNAKKDGNSGNC